MAGILAPLREGKFTTLAAVDSAVGGLLADLNTGPFKRLPGSRETAYRQLDRPALKALPVSRYEFARYHEARVNIDSLIAINKHFYSVLQAPVHQKVESAGHCQQSQDPTLRRTGRGPSPLLSVLRTSPAPRY
jgi:hypothetical protein